MLGRYKGLSIEIKASIWYTICNIVQKGIALLSTPIYTRIMSTDQYGLYTIYQSWYSIIMIFATLNLFYSAYITGLVKYSHDRSRLTSSMQGLCTLITAVIFGFYICAYKQWNSILGLPLGIMIAMFIQLLCEPALTFWSAYQRYTYKYKPVIAITLLCSFLSTAIGVLSVLTVKHKAEARVFSYVAVQSIAGIICYIVNLRNGKSLYHKEYWKYSLKFNIPLIPHYLSYTVLNQSDRIMIGSIIGQAEAAIYSVAYTIAMMMQIVTTAISNAFTPFTYQAIKEKRFEEIRVTYNFLLLLVSCLSILIMLFAPEVIKIFAAKQYADAIWIIPPVSVSVYFLFLYPLFSSVEFYYESTKFIMIASSIGAALNIILNSIFITKFGYFAAGYTTLVCYIVFSLAHYLFYKKLLKKHLPEVKELYDIKFIIVLSLFMLASMIFVTYIYANTIARYMIILILIALMYLKRKTIFNQLKAMRQVKK